MRLVLKIGTSSLIRDGSVDDDVIAGLSQQIASVRGDDNEVVVVASGAVALGVHALGLQRSGLSVMDRQVANQVGQLRLDRAFDDALSAVGLRAAATLMSSLDFFERRQYLHVRDTLNAMLAQGIVPVLNEINTAPELSLGGNDRLAALLAHMIGADLLLLLTDTPGLFTADPRLDSEASLIEEIVEVDNEMERGAGGAGQLGTGGMASKLAAAKIAAWSGVPAVIAATDRPNVVADAVAGVAGVGTVIQPRQRQLRARKLWIAFAIRSSGRVVVDDGARKALAHSGRSLLPAGVVGVQGDFHADDAVEVIGEDGVVFAKGLVRQGAGRLGQWAGKQTSELPPDMAHVVIHRDDLVVLPT